MLGVCLLFFNPPECRHAKEGVDREAGLGVDHLGSSPVKGNSMIRATQDLRVGVGTAIIGQFAQPPSKEFAPSTRLWLLKEGRRGSVAGGECAPCSGEQLD